MVSQVAVGFCGDLLEVFQIHRRSHRRVQLSFLLLLLLLRWYILPMTVRKFIVGIPFNSTIFILRLNQYTHSHE